jgi:uncharacterized protein YebE (UPF0316 family)
MTSTSALVYLAALVFLATASVSLWTLRVAVTAKGRKTAAATIAAIEAIVFLVAFSRAVAGLTAPERVGAYALGVGLGTLLGLAVDRRLNPRHAQVEVVAPGPAHELLDALHERGWPTTSSMGYGFSGNVVIASVTVDEHRLHALLDDLRQIAPDAFWTVRTVRAAKAVPLPAAFLQIGRRTQAPGGQPPPAAPGETFSHPRRPAPLAAPNSRHLQEPSPLHRSTRRVVVRELSDKARRDSPDGPCDNGPGYQAGRHDAARDRSLFAVKWRSGAAQHAR